MLVKMFHGFCMALADSVPGVSGGTVAFILGFYEKFIDALHGLFGKDNGARKVAVLYLAKLGVGWCLGLCLSVVALNDLFQTKTYFLSSLFLGLTAAAFPFILRTEWWALKGKGRYLPYTRWGGPGLRANSWQSGLRGGVIDYWSLGVGELLYLFVAGALAIMAMVLPGISGSTLLLIFGVYAPTLYALRRLLALDLAVLPGLFALALGVLVGVGVSIRWIRAALRRNRAKMLYFILGLMAGSLYAIVMGPTTLSPPQQALHLETFHLGGFVLGVGILIGLERLKLLIARREARAEKTEDGTQGEEEAQSGGSPQGPA
ncbi:MAG: DUF368 domain-containing protein [Evtepia gabavorous]